MKKIIQIAIDPSLYDPMEKEINEKSIYGLSSDGILYYFSPDGGKWVELIRSCDTE